MIHCVQTAAGTSSALPRFALDRLSSHKLNSKFKQAHATERRAAKVKLTGSLIKVQNRNNVWRINKIYKLIL
jgi:hypothetical protein